MNQTIGKMHVKYVGDAIHTSTYVAFAQKAPAQKVMMSNGECEAFLAAPKTTIADLGAISPSHDCVVVSL